MNNARYLIESVIKNGWGWTSTTGCGHPLLAKIC
jgi:hypothetical protein